MSLNLNLVYFFGAGASVPFGVPTMREMVQEFELKIEGETKEFYQALKNSFIDNYFDLESLLYIINEILDEDFFKNPFYLFLQNNYNLNLNKIEKDFLEKARGLKSKVLSFIIEKTSVISQHDKISELFDQFFQDFPKKWIFTTNYDKIIETYFKLKPLDYYSGIERFEGRDFFIPFNFSEEKGINIIPIHGSVDLILRKDGKIENIITKDKFSYELKEFMIFPAFKKLFNHSAYFEMFFKLLRQLQRAEKFIVIGYSFRDYLINLILIDSLLKNKRLIVYLLDPNGTEIKKHLLDKLSLYTCPTCEVENNVILNKFENRIILIKEKFDKKGIDKLHNIIKAYFFEPKISHIKDLEEFLRIFSATFSTNWLFLLKIDSWDFISNFISKYLTNYDDLNSTEKSLIFRYRMEIYNGLKKIYNPNYDYDLLKKIENFISNYTK